VAKAKDGREQFIQTDHRTAEEIRLAPELSVLFALVRILNPKRSVKPEAPEPAVLYLCQNRPPDFLQGAIRAAGAQLIVDGDGQPLPAAGPAPGLEEVLEPAFRGLAQRTAAEHDVELTVKGLERVEAATAAAAGTPEQDEIRYWSAVMKLAAFGGEVLRAGNGGQWRVVNSGSLPFALFTTFRGEEATVNLLGKAIKRFANGEGDSLVTMVAMIRSNR
jgi:hypothetical protein